MIYSPYIQLRERFVELLIEKASRQTGVDYDLIDRIKREVEEVETLKAAARERAQ